MVDFSPFIRQRRRLVATIDDGAAWRRAVGPIVGNAGVTCAWRRAAYDAARTGRIADA